MAIILGATLFIAATATQQDKGSNKALKLVTLAALAVQVVSSELHMASLGAGEAAGRMSLEILSSNGTLIVLKWALLVGGVGIFYLREATWMTVAPQFSAVTAGGSPADAGETTGAANGQIAWISACAVLIAAFIGKVLFFSSMVTLNIGL